MTNEVLERIVAETMVAEAEAEFDLGKQLDRLKKDIEETLLASTSVYVCLGSAGINFTETRARIATFMRAIDQARKDLGLDAEGWPKDVRKEVTLDS